MSREWLRWWRRLGLQDRTAMSKAWALIRARLGTKNRRQVWHWARGPMSALQLALQRIGWEGIGPVQWKDCAGHCWCLNGLMEQSGAMLESMRKDAVQAVWAQAAKHWLGSGLDEGSDLYSYRRLLEKWEDKGWHREAGALRA
eukprot:4059725-Amphidinium_carterae.1